MGAVVMKMKEYLLKLAVAVVLLVGVALIITVYQSGVIGWAWSEAVGFSNYVDSKWSGSWWQKAVIIFAVYWVIKNAVKDGIQAAKIDK